MHKSLRILFTFAIIALCGPLTGCNTKLKVARHEKRGDSLFASGDYAKAEIEYLNVLRLSNLNNHAIAQLADIYYQQGRFRRAFPFIQKACELDTNNVDLRVKLASIYLTAHHGKEAREAAELVLEQSPTNAEAPDILAGSVMTAADIELVQNRLEKLSKQIGQTAPVELALGRLAYLKGDAKAAESDLQRAIALDPKSHSAYNLLGSLYFSQNKRTEAESAFKKGSELAPLRSAQHLTYANFKIQTGDVAQGKQLISEITKQAPDYVPAWILEAQLALAEKKYEDCDSMLNQALALDSGNYDALILRGRMFLMQGQVEKSVAAMESMASIYDQAPEVFYQLAVAQLAAKDTVKATANVNKALFLQPKFPQAILLLAGLNISKGDLASAISKLTELIRQQPSIGEAYMLLATAYVIQKDFDKALAIYAKAAELFPKDPQIPFSTAMIFVQKKDSAQARKFFEKSLELSPEYIGALEGLVNLDLAESDFTSALNRVNQQTDEKLGPRREVLIAKIYIARARSLSGGTANSNDLKMNAPAAKQDVSLAETALLKAINLAPTDEVPYLILTQIYLGTGRDQKALDQLSGLVSKTNSVSAYMQIALIYEVRKDYPKARDAYEKALAANPEFGAALNNLAYLYLEHFDNVEKAYPLAEKAHQLAPADPSAADTLGWVDYKKGDYAQARVLLEESAAKRPKDAEVQFHVGMARYMLGDEGPARAALQQSTSASQNYPGREEAVGCLAILAIDPKTADAQAQADLEKRVHDEPNDSVAAARLGAIYERGGILAKAAQMYEQSLKQAPQNASLRGRLASIYVKLNQPDKALEMAKEAHKLAPADAATSGILGRLVFQSGDYNWAASLLQEAGRELPNDPDIQYSLAWSYYSIGRISDAVQAMENAVNGLSAGELADAREFLSLIAAVQNSNAAASAQADQVLSTNGDYVPALMVSAKRAEQQEKPDEAAGLYLKALARYPAFTPAARNLAVLCSRHPGENDQKAYDAGVKARTAYGDDSELLRALGVLGYRRGDYARAAQFLQDSSRIQKGDAEVFYYLGKALYQLKQSSASKAAFQQALALDTKSQWVGDARKVLAELK